MLLPVLGRPFGEALDPSGYLTRLQQCLSDTKPTDAPRAYVVVEKILARREELPEDWPISGTTGYEYLNYLNGPFVQLEGCQQIEAIYCEFTGKQAAFAEVVYEKKAGDESAAPGRDPRTGPPTGGTRKASTPRT